MQFFVRIFRRICGDHVCRYGSVEPPWGMARTVAEGPYFRKAASSAWLFLIY